MHKKEAISRKEQTPIYIYIYIYSASNKNIDDWELNKCNGNNDKNIKILNTVMKHQRVHTSSLRGQWVHISA